MQIQLSLKYFSLLCSIEKATAAAAMQIDNPPAGQCRKCKNVPRCLDI